MNIWNQSLRPLRQFTTLTMALAVVAGGITACATMESIPSV